MCCLDSPGGRTSRCEEGYSKRAPLWGSQTLNQKHWPPLTEESVGWPSRSGCLVCVLIVLEPRQTSETAPPGQAGRWWHPHPWSTGGLVPVSLPHPPWVSWWGALWNALQCAHLGHWFCQPLARWAGNRQNQNRRAPLSPLPFGQKWPPHHSVFDKNKRTSLWHTESATNKDVYTPLWLPSRLLLRTVVKASKQVSCMRGARVQRGFEARLQAEDKGGQTSWQTEAVSSVRDPHPCAPGRSAHRGPSHSHTPKKTTRLSLLHFN